MANGGHKKRMVVGTMKKRAGLPLHIKGYAFNLDTNNRRVRDFDDISKWCEAHHVSCTLNLMAENLQYADSLVGKELVFLNEAKPRLSGEALHHKNCVVIDNLEAITGHDFIDQNWTTEHYGFRGRMTIAAKVAEALKNSL